MVETDKFIRIAIFPLQLLIPMYVIERSILKKQGVTV